MLTNIAERLTAALAAAGLPVAGVSVGAREAGATPGNVRLDWPAPPTPDQEAAAGAAIAAFDFSAEADAAYAGVRATLAAVAWLAASPDPAAIALRVVLRDVYTQLNDERESRGLPRILEPETAARLVAAARAGAGAPITLGGPP